MPRLTTLDEVLFPVAEHPVFVSVTQNGDEKRLAVPEKKAIVNGITQRVLGIVGRGYRLVTNDEALKMAHECCRTVFPETKPGEWVAGGIDAPSTAGYCHIDLAHNSTALDFNGVPAAERPDAFGPFIRVTNSYNGLRALEFNIGYYRKVCTNGLMAPSTIIRFKFSHAHRDIGETIRFEVSQAKLAAFRTAFTDSLAGLRGCVAPRPEIESVVRGVLLLRPPEPLKAGTRAAVDWDALGTHVARLTSRYADELGENAYAAFNAITDFASRPPDNRCLHRDRHSLQRLAGSWLGSFNVACRKPGFSMAGHLEQWSKERAYPGPPRN